jgi:hypothetical protein
MLAAPIEYDPEIPRRVLLSDSAPAQNAAGPRAPWLLSIGAAIGLALATFGLLEPQTDRQGLSPDTAAQVGERTIRRIDYERVLAGVEQDLRNPLDESIRRRVLDRMVDEELLVQRALELGLAAIDRRVRGELTSGLMDSIVGEANADEASSREVARHYEENVDFFTRPGRLHAQTIFFSARGVGRRPDGTAAERAERAAAELRIGENAHEIENRLGDPQVSPLPNGMLPPSKVRDYVGPIILQSLEELAVGEWSEPIESGGGLYLARVIDREPPIIPAFEEIEDLVRQDLKRRRGDQALRDYLDDLRSQIPVAINESVFSASK